MQVFRRLHICIQTNTGLTSQEIEEPDSHQDHHCFLFSGTFGSLLLHESRGRIHSVCTEERPVFCFDPRRGGGVVVVPWPSTPVEVIAKRPFSWAKTIYYRSLKSWNEDIRSLSIFWFWQFWHHSHLPILSMVFSAICEARLTNGREPMNHTFALALLSFDEVGWHLIKAKSIKLRDITTQLNDCVGALSKKTVSNLCRSRALSRTSGWGLHHREVSFVDGCYGPSLSVSEVPQAEGFSNIWATFFCVFFWAEKWKGETFICLKQTRQWEGCSVMFCDSHSFVEERAKNEKKIHQNIG